VTLIVDLENQYGSRLSGTLLIFKVKCLWVNFLPYNNRVNRSKVKGSIFTAKHHCEQSRIKILLWILSKLGTYLVLRGVWNHIDFQGRLVNIHWRMLIPWCSQGCSAVKIWPLDLWPWKSIGFQTLVRTMHVPRLIKIHWRMLILECSQGCYAVKIWPDDRVWNPIDFQGQRSRGQIFTAQQLLPILEQTEKTLKAYAQGRQGILRIGVECYPWYEYISWLS
jgi:hypothetical protein